MAYINRWYKMDRPVRLSKRIQSSISAAFSFLICHLHNGLGTHDGFREFGTHWIPIISQRLGTDSGSGKNGIPQILLVGYSGIIIWKRPTTSELFWRSFFLVSPDVPNLTQTTPIPWIPNLQDAARVPNCLKFEGSFFRKHGLCTQPTFVLP